MGGKLQYLEIKNFMRWVATLKRSEPMIFTDIEELRRTVPAEYDFFTQYGVRSLIAVPFSKRLNQGYIGVDNPKRYGADPAFLFIIAYAVAQELNEIKLNKSLAAAKQALKLTAGEVRNRATANQLALILWPDESCEIPMKSVRNIAYRLRSLLGYVGLEDLVVYANGIFSFNPEIKVVTDVGLFEELCDSIEMENNPKKRYRLYEAAVGLYSGNLLPRLSDNIYFIPSITYYQGLYFRLAGRYIERQTECGEYVYAHKAAKAALAFDPFNSSLNMHLTILLYQQSGAGTANAFYTGIKRHLTEAHIQRIKQTCPNMII